MSKLIDKRSEILFLYDVTDTNPNGDPIDENKPRIDEETGVNIVTDVRLKRTIRDYLFDYKKHDVFVLGTREDDGKLKTKEKRMKDLNITKKDEAQSKCIDIRLFGATIAVKEKSITLTGPVQFKYGRSLHKVESIFIKGTTVMPSDADNKQGTFTERYMLPYSLIAFYGIVNENAAKKQGINLTEDDIHLLLEAMWRGTQNLISCSKFGQMPRLLMQVIYKEGNFYIGELDKRIKLLTDINEKALRHVTDFQIDITSLAEVLLEHQNKIDKIRVMVDKQMRLIKNNAPVSIQDAFSPLTVEALIF